ncbi:hypothetical protein J2S01_002023 [Pectinatus haikarae]|uniref:Uncharacterized protein n=1 Tax=Pectinatus haikarae TaxID=349096 RepID=A0ABT9Y8X4_9FIRM|nr:hypothetical protein [Pectinatus haikarae]
MKDMKLIYENSAVKFFEFSRPFIANMNFIKTLHIIIFVEVLLNFKFRKKK